MEEGAGSGSGLGLGCPAANSCVPFRGRGPRSGEGVYYGTWRKWLDRGRGAPDGAVAGGWFLVPSYKLLIAPPTTVILSGAKDLGENSK
jgi:hypothetical protein